MRLIDADALINDLVNDCNKDQTKMLPVWIEKQIDAQPTVTLLKEQEAVEPRVSTAEQRCGHCNKVIEMDGWQSCPWCGKRIDWKGWWKKNGTRNQNS